MTELRPSQQRIAARFHDDDGWTPVQFHDEPSEEEIDRDPAMRNLGLTIIGVVLLGCFVMWALFALFGCRAIALGIAQ